MIVGVPVPVPLTFPLDVVVISPVPTPSEQALKALLTGSTGVLAFKMDATEDAHFVYAVRSTSALSVVTPLSTATAAIAETSSRDPYT